MLDVTGTRRSIGSNDNCHESFVTINMTQPDGSYGSGKGCPVGMKPKRMFYTGLGFVTYKVGKILAKRKVQAALHGPKSDKST